ncbi:ANTAR domain-containing protein [Streptomyces sp. NPDC046465]|uniref:ANTAR domain-containing protein n=1 Tax=Streptomyces sp. NPDC046465 TaxID=3155810 RepID=UPI0033D80E15
MSRQQHITRTFLELADTLVEDFDVIDFLHQMTLRCQELLDITDAGVFLAHPPPHLHSPAPCDPGPTLQDLLNTACQQGPALDAVSTQRPVTLRSGDDAASRWPQFAADLQRAGYTQAIAVPMRLRQDIVGSLLLLHTGPRTLDAEDFALAQALASAATIGLLHARTITHQHTVNGQLHTALHSRIMIEQAKGLLAARQNITLNHAFDALRHHARSHRTLLSDVARDVIDGEFTPVIPPARPRAHPTDAE